MSEREREVHLVFVGAGHCHCLALVQLARDLVPQLPTTVTLISDSAFAYYSGMLPAAVAGQFREDELRIDVAALCRALAVRFVLGRATRIEHAAKRVHVQRSDSDAPCTIEYDLLSVNVGSVTRGAELDGVSQHAICTRPIALLPARLAAREADFTALQPPRCPTVLVVGGGAAGCELAMAVCGRHRALFGAADVSLLTSCTSELGTGGARLSSVLKAALQERGIKLIAGRAIRVDADRTVHAVDSSNNGVASAHAAELVLWAAGASPGALLAASDLPLSGDGFLDVRRSLQSVASDFVFACGDCCTVRDSPQIEKAGVFAVREAPILAQNLCAARHNLAHPEAPKPYVDYAAQASFLRLIITGDGGAIGCKWGFATPSSSAANWLKSKLDLDFIRLFDANRLPRNSAFALQLAAPE
jgi:selenide,water dikinase